MKFPRRCLWLLITIFAGFPALADDATPSPATEPLQSLALEAPAPEPLALEAPSGVEFSARGQETKAFRLNVWQLEHDKIQQIRASRRNPTERGLWYSSRSREERDGRRLSDAQYPLIFSEMALLAASRNHRAAWQGAQAVVVTGLITMSLKRLLPRRRPYPNDEKFGTFPSGHTSTTFAMAGVLGAAQPNFKVPALLAASAVGWARVKVRAHHWPDVLVGAALGLAVSNQFKPQQQRGARLADLKLRF